MSGSQKYDLLLKGGLMIDPARGIRGNRDIGVGNGKVQAVSEDIPVSDARKAISLKGRIVVPGLIDMHCHPGVIDLGTVDPDDIGIFSGVTALCEGGESGAGNFYPMRRHELEPADTDMFCFLNFAVTGLAGFPQPEIRQENDINPDITRRVVEENRDVIKGIKLRAIGPLADSMGIGVVKRAKELARELGLPLVVHVGEGRARVPGDTIDAFTRSVVKMMDCGDVLSHFMTWEAGGLILPDGAVYPELSEARNRGVVLDACVGRSHFSFETARHAIDQGLLPTVITTDINAANESTVQSLPVTMSKFLNLGLTIDQVVAMTTANPAEALGEGNRRGSLGPGMPADITVLDIVAGDYVFSDGKGGGRIIGDRLIEPRLVIKNGREVPCMSRYRLLSEVHEK